MAPSFKTAAATLAGTVATALAARSLDAKYNIRSDLGQLRAGLKSKRHFEQLCKQYGEDDWSFYHVLHKTHGLNDYGEAFLFEDRSWTYAQFRAEVGRLALALQQLGVGNRTVVGMFINNSPEFYILWWALFKIGAIPAPLNTSIAQEPFRHCLQVSAAEYLICSYELYNTMADSLDLTETVSFSNGLYSDSRISNLKSIVVYDYGTYPQLPLCPGVTILSQSALPEVSPDMASWPPESRPNVKSTDVSQYLFTSGTTGLPKAGTFPTAFCHMSANPHRWPVMFQKKRRAYLCPPMFHGGATYAVLPAVVATGGTIVLARKFSVRNFWHDIRRTRSDLVFYIGEMIRYLVQVPPDPVHPDETRTHQLEIIYGMGLAEPIWREFRRRFGVPWISEYYGATEGTTVICYSDQNKGGEVAKVAHWGPLMRYMQDMFYILKVDMESGELIRDSKTGLCIQAAYGEIGESVNRVRPPLQTTHDYVGENGEEQTKKKLVQDVFEKGDLFVRLGDALSMDENGYVTFHDRLGETYRAKGHNISTAEVENAFDKHPQIASANVFAINMTQFGYDGQVGCAAITMHDGTEEKSVLQTLESHLTAKGGLPGYAVPRFVRVLTDGANSAQNEKNVSDAVGSEHVNPIFKKIKMDLRKAGFAPPPESGDRMYWIEREGSGFTPLGKETQQRLLNGKAKL